MTSRQEFVALIRRRMKETKIKEYQIAEQLGMCDSTLTHKLNGNSDFKLGEAMAICEILGLRLDLYENVPELGV